MCIGEHDWTHFFSSAELAKSLGSKVLAAGKVDVTSEVHSTYMIQKKPIT